MNSMNKSGLEMSFAWLFAIIAGVFILFLAIYFAMNIAQQGQYKIDSSTAKNLDILLNPLQSGEGITQSIPIVLPSETRIYNDCDNNGNFGTQMLAVSQKTGFNSGWPRGVELSFSNKYIFSNYTVQGKKFYVFSKSFDYPFPLASLIIFIPEEEAFSFYNTPTEVRNEIQTLQVGLSLSNIYFNNYPAESTKICFGNLETNCNVRVIGTCTSNCDSEYDEGYVEKNGKQARYVTKSLMYAAIFSDLNLYECQSKRLMQRARQLALVYREEGQLISVKKCNTNNLDADLLQFSNAARNFNGEFGLLNSLRDSMNDKNNENGVCKLW